VASTAVSPPVPIGKSKNSDVRWLGTGAETKDRTPYYQLGNNSQHVELPISVKTMKRRTVKIAVWPVNRPGTSGIFADEAGKTAFENSLEAQLNVVFAYQINAWSDVSVNPNKTFDYLDGTASGTTATPYTIKHGTKDKAMVDEYRDAVSDINVFLISNTLYTGNGADPASSVILGSSYPANFPGSDGRENSVVVNMSTYHTHSTDQLRTIAHEIGHLMVGPGHPDQYLEFLPETGGFAPLQSIPGEHPKRLMHSNSSSGRLLVKKEWDLAELWLINRPNGDN
jgi:hypothetical protein